MSGEIHTHTRVPASPRGPNGGDKNNVNRKRDSAADNLDSSRGAREGREIPPGLRCPVCFEFQHTRTMARVDRLIPARAMPALTPCRVPHHCHPGRCRGHRTTMSRRAFSPGRDPPGWTEPPRQRQRPQHSHRLTRSGLQLHPRTRFQYCFDQWQKRRPAA